MLFLCLTKKRYVHYLLNITKSLIERHSTVRIKNMSSKIKFYNRISFRIALTVLLIIILGIGLTVYFYVKAQNEAIINSRVIAIREESEILHISIKNNMLAGEAPIAVQLFEDFSRSDFISDVKLYRANGEAAFSDNTTLSKVNEIIGMERFAPKEIFQQFDPETSEEFTKAVSTVIDVSIQRITRDDKRITIYTPLINQPKCAGCHGLDHVVRGVVCISSPLNETYEATYRNTILSSGIGIGIIILLTFAITLMLNRTVIRKILKIGLVAQKVGEGDLKQKVDINSHDEFGILAEQMNRMVDGLNERFKLSKFVSKSTLEHVQSSEDLMLGGERREVTVLFTDIRGFTQYSEFKNPEEVMVVLNTVMHLQSEIIQNYGGDIDKYVGDEIMAVYEGEDMVERACRAAVQIREILKEKASSGDIDVSVGIGINTGEVIMGNMGSAERIDRTIIGDTVNLGSRLCSLAGKGTIVISESTYARIENNADVKKHQAISIKGKSKPVQIYTLKKLTIEDQA